MVCPGDVEKRDFVHDWLARTVDEGDLDSGVLSAIESCVARGTVDETGLQKILIDLAATREEHDGQPGQD